MKAKCSCAHKAQDELNGDGIRVFNLIKTATGKSYRCTVCEKVMQTKASEPEKKAK